MRSLLFATMLMACVAHGFVDFHGMSGAPKKWVHPETGNIHYSHDVHHTFPHPFPGKEPTYFKAKYTAEHEAHWNIIELHEHVEGLKGVGCKMTADGKDVDTIAVVNPSASLLAAVHLQKEKGYSHTAIVAGAQYHCNGKNIFRRLTNVVENDDGSILLLTKEVSYNHIFKNVDMQMKTNHVHQIGPKSTDEAHRQNLIAAIAAAPKMSMNRHPLQRPMSTQHWFHHIFHKISHAVTHVVHSVSHAASDAAHKVEHAAKTVAHDVGTAAKTVGHDVATGAKDVGHAVVKAAKDVYSAISSFHIDKDFHLPGIHWNKDISKTFSQWDMAVSETIRLSAMFSFEPSVTFNLQIHEWHLENLEAYFEGITEAAVTGSFSLDIQKVIGGSKVITDIKIHQITFSIGPVPVWIKPSIPIYAGFDVSFDADFTVSAVVSAQSTVKWGYAYSPATGHRHISEHDFSWKHTFGPMDYTISIGVGVYVMPVISVTIESVGAVEVGARVQADAVLQSNDDCLIAIDINANPTISLNAGINLHLLKHPIFQHQFGPYTLWTTKIPIYNWCKPQKASVKKFLGSHTGGQSWDSGNQFSRGMLQQATSGHIVKTSEKALTTRHAGKSWNGKSISMVNGMTVDMVYGAQFSAGEDKKGNYSLLYFNLALAARAPNQPQHYEGKMAATATIVYKAYGFPKVGTIMNYSLVQMENVSYSATSNSTHLPLKPSPWILWKTSNEDVRFVEVESVMTFGTVGMISPQADNNTAKLITYNVEEPNSMDVDGLKMTKKDVLIVIVYAGAATLALIVTVVAAISCYRRFTTARRSADILGAKEEGANGLINAQETDADVSLPQA